MIKYPTELKEKSPAIGTGRVLIIDDMTKLTPHKFFDYISEGFVPVVLVKDGTVTTPEFVHYHTEADEVGNFTVGYGSGDAEISFNATWDENYYED